MSDFTHCQLLYTRLPSSAFLNMHALHFATTFQIQMDVPCSFFYSPLPHLPLSCLCNSALFVVDPISRFDPSCGAEADCAETDRQTDKTKAHQLAGINASAVPITVPTHPFARMNPSLSASWCQTRIRFFVLTAADTHATPPALPQHHFTVRSGERIGGSFFVSVSRWRSVGCEASSTLLKFTSSALRNLWPGGDLRNSSCQESRGSSLEGDSGGRDWRSGLAAYPFCLSASWLNDLIHLQKVYLKIKNDCSIWWDLML